MSRIRYKQGKICNGVVATTTLSLFDLKCPKIEFDHAFMDILGVHDDDMITENNSSCRH